MRELLPHAHELRVRCLATLPVVGIAGAALGAGIARSAGSPMGSTILWFASAMCVSSYLSAMLEAATLTALRLDPRGLNADIAGFAWDGALGIISGLLLARITSVDALQAAGFASAILFIQRLVLEKLVLGNVVGESFAALLQGGGMRPEPDYSRAAALAMRGEFGAARHEYERAIAETPSSARPYIGLARMLRDDAHDYDAAAEVFERALRQSAADKPGCEVVTRELAELYLHRLGRPGRASTLLARFLDTRDVPWARVLLRQAKSESL